MIFGINTTCDISKLSQITYNNFEISLVVFMPNITTNHAFLYKPVVRLRAALQYCHAMLVFWLAVCSEQVAIQISICCLRKRFFVLEYCELTAMASNTVTSVSKREKVTSLWSSGNCSLTELASIAVAIDESRKTY